MTDQQYIKCKEKNIPIYKIYINKNKIRQIKCKYENFDDSWILRDWINEKIPYDTVARSEFMYASEDKLEFCKKKLIKHLKDEQKRIIQNARKQIDKLNNIQ